MSACSNIGSGPNFVKLIARLLTVVAYFGDSAFAGGMTGCEPDQVACEWMLARGCASPTPSGATRGNAQAALQLSGVYPPDVSGCGSPVNAERAIAVSESVART